MTHTRFGEFVRILRIDCHAATGVLGRDSRRICSIFIGRWKWREFYKLKGAHER